MTDYNGNIYSVVQIGSQYWTAQNWRCTSLKNGTPLTLVNDDTTWAGLSTEGYSAYDKDPSNV